MDMDIERALKNIGDWISKETESRKYPKGELLELSESLQALKAEIARQSVTSEEVQRAIEWVTNTRHRNQYMSGDWTAPMGNHINRTIQDTIITALQAYQPWIPVSERLPERGKHVLLCCEVRPSG